MPQCTSRSPCGAQQQQVCKMQGELVRGHHNEASYAMHLQLQHPTLGMYALWLSCSASSNTAKCNCQGVPTQGQPQGAGIP
jgi:hypothetical protein